MVSEFRPHQPRSAQARYAIVSLIGLLILLCSGCGHETPPTATLTPEGSTMHWVEVKDSGYPPSSLRISPRVFPPNVTTVIQFSLPFDASVSLTIYDAEGTEVAKPVNRQNLQAGTYEVEWHASDVGTGVYLFTVVVQELSQGGQASSTIHAESRKMLLVK